MSDENRRAREELWKDIKGYEGYYQVSNSGRVKSLNRIVKDSTRNRVQRLEGKIINQCDNGKGYKVVYLTKNKKRKNFYVHRLVAESFIENPNNYPEINHKDLNKNNNDISNLEWITSIENKRHYQRTETAKIKNKEKGILRAKQYREKIESKIPLILDMYKNKDKSIEEINYITKVGKSYISKLLKDNNIKLKVRKSSLERDNKGRFIKKAI